MRIIFNLKRKVGANELLPNYFKKREAPLFFEHQIRYANGKCFNLGCQARIPKYSTPMNQQHLNPWEQPDEVLEEISHSHELVVWNDDENTFDWVIESLIDICNHTFEQAEQCSLIIHHKGKYAVRSGAYEQLKPMKGGLIDRGINATIEN